MKVFSGILFALLVISFLGNVVLINKYRVRGNEMNTVRLEAEQLRIEKAEVQKDMQGMEEKIKALEAEKTKLMTAVPAKKK